MDAETQIEEAGRRLARDMMAIRKDREISREAVVKATKAAPNVLDEFERTALVGNPMYNRVYLRLFMRGYAEVIGIRTDDALRAADEMLGGNYTDRLARLYLDEPPEEPAPIVPPEEDEAAESDDDADADTAAAVPPAADEEQPSDDAPEPPVAAPPPTAPPKAPTPTRPRPSTRRTSSGPSAATVRAIVAGLGVVLLAAVVWYFWPSSPEEPVAEVVPADTLPPPAPVLPPRIVLGDTTSFFVIAARDTLNPIRVTVDGGIRAPYWIEFLDSLEFRVTDSIVLEQRLSAVDVSVADVLVPTDRLDASNRLLITKAGVQQHLDSLRTAGAPPFDND